MDLSRVNPNLIDQFDADSSFDPTVSKEASVMRAMAILYLARIADKRPPMWISYLGQSGAGKTALAIEIMKFLQRRIKPVNKIDRPDYFRCDSWTYGMIKGYQIDSALGVGLKHLDEYSKLDFLMIDDVGTGYESGKGYSTHALFSLMNERVDKWTIVTSNKFLNGLMEMDERVVNRIKREGNVWFEHTGESYIK